MRFLMYRDNTKDMTPGLKASRGSKSDVVRNASRPGSRNHNKPAGADSVMSANGKTPRPGYKQKTVKSPGSGSVARPGFAQGINR